MITEANWGKYRVGIDYDTEETDLNYTRKDWDLGSENLIDKRLIDLVPELLRHSRFHPTMFKSKSWIGDYHGGILSSLLRVYSVQPHETSDTQRLTGFGSNDQCWININLNEHGEIVGDNSLDDIKMKYPNMGIGWLSKVTLNNLTTPGTFGGYAHFPMLDIIKPPTQANMDRLIDEVKKRTGLEKFVIVQSSELAMMVLGVELVDEERFSIFLHAASLMNHFETNNDVWVDDRWLARSTQNFAKELGLPNLNQLGGILRINSVPPLKPQEPKIVAVSF
jgi:hypothetical protein